MDGGKDIDTAARNDALAEAASTARTIIGYSIEGAATAMGVPAAIIADVESGRVVITDDLRGRIEACYQVDLDTFIRPQRAQQPRLPLAYDEEKGILRVGTLGVRWRKEVDTNDALLRGFSSAIRRQRRLAPSVPLRLRQADIPMLANLLDLTDVHLDERAQFWFGQTPETAQSFRAILKVAKRSGISEAA
ncbi:MAG: hypothetical protein ACR2P0_18675 [Acidimicrobiales bacterium]